MIYNVNNQYFRCDNYKCSTTIHGFSPLPFEYMKGDIREIMMTYACFCGDFSIKDTMKIVKLSKPSIIHWFDLFGEQIVRKNLNEIINNPLEDFVQIDESLFTKRKYEVGRIVSK